MKQSTIPLKIHSEDIRSNRWRKGLVGQLPLDFLRVDVTEFNENTNFQRSTASCNPTISQFVAPNHFGRLSLTCVQAKLIRNYGIARMDPYVRVRVGHYVYETQTCQNGGKTPRWNRIIQCQLTTGVKTIHLEIYDECSFQMDELIAWCDIAIPEKVFQGETHEYWYPLTGKQGEGLEGTINLVLSCSPQLMQSYIYQSVAAPPNMIQESASNSMFLSPIQQSNNLAVGLYSAADLKQVCEMFPNVDEDVIKSVFEVNRGNKDNTINNLLQMI